MLAGVRQHTLLCGHVHIQYRRPARGPRGDQPGIGGPAFRRRSAGGMGDRQRRPRRATPHRLRRRGGGRPVERRGRPVRRQGRPPAAHRPPRLRLRPRSAVVADADHRDHDHTPARGVHDGRARRRSRLGRRYPRVASGVHVRTEARPQVLGSVNVVPGNGAAVALVQLSVAVPSSRRPGHGTVAGADFEANLRAEARLVTGWCERRRRKRQRGDDQDEK